MSRLPVKMLAKLKAARKAATLENASFGMPSDRVRSVSLFDDEELEAHPTDYIRRKVRVHHTSWIIGPLDEVIEWAEGKKR